jgi:5'-3' exonuclease
MNYILVDSLNMFMRAKHVTARTSDMNMKIGMALHIMFNSVKKVWREFDGDHVIFCLEGRSWRKDFYEPYKKNRKVIMDQRSPRQQEEDELFFEAYDEMIEFFRNKTNCSVLHHPQAEADDLIAMWTQEHPSDNHIIVSTDSDFYQLISDNVSQYNGTTDQIVKKDGIFEAKTMKRAIDKKTQEPKEVPDPKWLLFEKCVRGDTSDNVFSAYPGARKKGSGNKTGMMEAFADMDKGGFDFNNFMLQRWVDHDGIEHRVLDDFERNKILIDLTQQPDEIKNDIRQVFDDSSKQRIQNVGIHFMKFCNKWNMPKLTEAATEFGEILNACQTK